MLNLIVSLLILPLMATDTAKQVRFTPKDLPYAYDALAPQVSEETLRFHHDKHYVGYVNKLNELIVDTPYAEQPLEDIVVSADGAIFNNAAPMPSQPSGTASTGRSSKSATPRNSGFRLGKDAVSRFGGRRFFVSGFHAAEGFRGRRICSAGYTGSEILYISVIRRRKFWREKIGGNGKKYYLYFFDRTFILP